MSDQEDKKSKYGNVSGLDLSALNSIYSSQSAAPKKGPEYIAFNTRGRDFYGRLSFNTGIFWIGGFVGGGLFGAYEGLANASSSNFKVRMNSVMNALSRRGSVVGSTLGIVAFLHTSAVYAADTADLEKFTGLEAVTPLFAGALTGAIIKINRGPRAALLASSIGAVASTVYWYGSSYVSDIVLGRGGRY